MIPIKYLLLASLIFSTPGILNAQNALTVNDTRGAGTTPSSYAQSFEAHFKQAGVIGLDPGTENSYYAVLGLRGWLSDNSGGKAHELAFTNGGRIMFRSGYSPSWEAWKDIVIANENGSVGIGTTNTGSNMLAVGGTIAARKVKVTMANPWPDYVFSEEYDLPSIASIEKYIAEHKHLPGIPSAETVEKDGLDLAEINMKLLEKIEQLTLYIVELNKRVEKLESKDE